MSNYYCRLCSVNSMPEDSSLFSKELIEMIKYSIPEFDFTLVNNPIICGKCNFLLQQITSFKKKCLQVQAHIKAFIMKNDTLDRSINISMPVALNSSSATIPPSNINFDDSYRKFLKENDKKKDEEISVDMNGTENMSNEDFLNLLESSSNIKKVIQTDITISSKSDGNLSSNFYNDSFNDDADTSSCNNDEIGQEVRPTEKPISKSPKVQSVANNPIDVKVDGNTCVTCDMCFPNVQKLVQHIYIMHRKSKEMMNCLLCRYKTFEQSNILKHYKKMHSNCTDLRSSCIFCYADKKNFKDLLTHMRSEHKKVCSLSRYKCNSCNFKTRSYNAFKKHFFQSHDLICNYCLKACDSVEFLNRHIGCHLIAKNKKYNNKN